MESACFWNANLKGTSFRGAKLNDANFTLANLAQADFTGSQITDSQLHSALSIRDARLPNGSLGRDPNLLVNGYADCNTFVQTNWYVREGVVDTVIFNNNSSNCRFVARSPDLRTAMSQSINLTNVWNPIVWTRSGAGLLAQMADGVSVQIIGMSSNRTVLGQKSLSETRDSGYHHS